jgi:ABC-type transport system substrate-binding protein
VEQDRPNVMFDQLLFDVPYQPPPLLRLTLHRIPPFDNPELRQAMALSLDHQAFIDILTLG